MDAFLYKKVVGQLGCQPL